MKSNAIKIPFCGIMTALSVVILFLASLIGIATFAGPVLASIILPIVALEYKRSVAITVYIAVSILSLIIIPDRELAAAYICLAWYPLIRDIVGKVKPKLINILLRLIIYSACVFAFCYLSLLITGIGFGEGNLSRIIVAVLFLAGAFTFLLMDKVYEKFTYLWLAKWGKQIFRK